MISLHHRVMKDKGDSPQQQLRGFGEEKIAYADEAGQQHHPNKDDERRTHQFVPSRPSHLLELFPDAAEKRVKTSQRIRHSKEQERQESNLQSRFWRPVVYR